MVTPHPQVIPEPDIEIVYSDQDLLVVNKPANLLSIPDGYDKTTPTLPSLLEQAWGRLWVVHRLDKGTSGLIVFARNSHAHQHLNQQFRERNVSKRYHAVVMPPPLWESLDLNEPLQINADRMHRTRVDLKKGKPAETKVRVIKAYPQTTLLECVLVTGFTHQIRAHLYHQGIWIIGDELYNPLRPQAALLPRSDRILLHACELGFTHPSSFEALIFRVKNPACFDSFLN